MEPLVPQKLEELLPLIDNEKRRIAAGCTDIIVAVKAGKLNLMPIIDINNIEEINNIKVQDGVILIGGNVTLSNIIKNEIITRKVSILTKALKTIGSPQIRNRATLAGNICNASPSGDGILALTCLDAGLILRSESGQRMISIADFITGVGKKDLHNDEFIEYITIPDKYSEYESYYEKVGLRNSMVISICSMALMYKEQDEIVKDIRIAYGAVAPKTIRIIEAENYLKGKKINQENIKEASRIIEKSVMPIGDVRASAEYRKKVSKNLIFRILE